MSQIAQQLQAFKFVDLFNQLGWDRFSVGIEKEVGGQVFKLQPVAQKRGIQILHCLPDSEGAIPPYAIRQKIERKVTADAREHLIIFTDAAQTRQIWQWVSRATGRPTQYREVKWQAGQPTELLEQKLKAISFDLDEEERLTVFGVAERLRGGFDRDNVTKKFYKVFQAQRDAFQKFIDGIPSDDHQRWYTAVIIDRLMFLWFLQEKFFLDGNKRYLRNRLEAHLAAAPGTSFYKRFLNPLFFRGFAEERTDANRTAIEREFGKVPYLNGGLFAEHELEREYGAAIDIPDTAFSSLFAFFDEWDWHLDERPLASGKEINPDVLGYIFEKFVNQKQMGAYYTKEDITEYIAKNTIPPCLFEKVRADNKAAFDAHAWPLLQEDPRRYIYPAMLHGLPPVDISDNLGSLPFKGRAGVGMGLDAHDNPIPHPTSPLKGEEYENLYPPEIAAGLDTQAPDLLERRKPWNKTAAPSHGLPTEIWRETIARHNRTREILAKLQAGEINSVADLITYNLDIRQFAQDVIERCTDPALLRAFWVALAGRLPRKSNEKYRHGMSVLDPTCGSGAFLFAALQILKPLYQACLTAMSGALLDAQLIPSPARGRGRSVAEGEGALNDIEEIVERFQAAAVDRVRDYAITKHIIVHNLYGVDIETQATEIAKLRLFLKLVALLEPGDNIEPLPDIDFNIRAGNTLVGYASADETERAVKGATQGNLFSDAWEDIRIRLTAVEQAYNNFQIQQVQRGGHVTAEDKQALGDQLHELEETLNYHLCREYGKDPTKAKQYDAWKASHKPFHWYVDFYPIMAAGGFDVVIGNPPYVETSDVSGYQPKNLQLWSTGNLFAVCIERFSQLLTPSGLFSVIVPISAVSTPRMTPLLQLCNKRFNNFWASSYAVRPGKLFVGVDMNLSILTGGGQGSSMKQSRFTTAYTRWSSEQRDVLFQTLGYYRQANLACKVGDAILQSVLTMAAGRSGLAEVTIRSGLSCNETLFVHSGGRYFRKCSTTQFSNEYKPLSLPAEWRYGVAAALSSTTFYLIWLALSDCYHVTKRDVDSLVVSTDMVGDRTLNQLGETLLEDMFRNAVKRIRRRKDGTTQEEMNFRVGRSKELIDQVDAVLAKHYGFTDEQLDYIINYDIKYRMGLNGQEDDADD